MSECIRSVRVLVEVDTNKQTYALDERGVEIDEVGSLVADFLERCAE